MFRINFTFRLKKYYTGKKKSRADCRAGTVGKNIVLLLLSLFFVTSINVNPVLIVDIVISL